MGSFDKFKAKPGGGSSLAKPKIGGGNSGIGALMAMMVAQQKGGGLQQQLGSNAIATKGTDAATGAEMVNTDNAALAGSEALNQTLELKNALKAVDRMEGLANKLPGGRVQGTIASGKAEASGGEGEDADVKLYNDFVQAHAIIIARAMNPGVRFTNYEAQSVASPLIWHPNESPDLRAKKFALVRESLSGNLNTFSGKQDSGISPPSNQSQVQGDAPQVDPVESIKQRFRQRKP